MQPHRCVTHPLFLDITQNTCQRYYSLKYLNYQKLPEGKTLSFSGSTSSYVKSHKQQQCNLKTLSHPSCELRQHTHFTFTSMKSTTQIYFKLHHDDKLPFFYNYFLNHSGNSSNSSISFKCWYSVLAKLHGASEIWSRVYQWKRAF